MPYIIDIFMNASKKIYYEMTSVTCFVTLNKFCCYVFFICQVAVPGLDLSLKQDNFMIYAWLRI